MAYSKAVKTQAGVELLSRVIAGETTIMFSKVAISDTSIDAFVAKQELVPMATKFTRDTKVGVLLNAVFSNTSLTTGYDVNTIALYAKDGSNVEVLFAYLYAIDDPLPMTAYDGNVPQSVNLQMESGIYLDDGSMIIVDPSGVATMGYVNEQISNNFENTVKPWVNTTISTYVNTNVINKLNSSGVKSATVTASGTWTTSGDLKYQDVSVTGLKTTDAPIISKNTTNKTAAQIKAINKDYANFAKYECVAANTLRIFTLSQPTVDIPIWIMGVGL